MLHNHSTESPLHDCGPDPTVLNIDAACAANRNYRTALWTGEHLQLTLMCIPVGGDIGMEMHADTDQFLRVHSGYGIVRLGSARNCITEEVRVNGHSAIMIPAGTWHNIVNVGRTPLRLYSVYAPPHHPHGTVHATKEEAQEAQD